jgi:hypothetical protein
LRLPGQPNKFLGIGRPPKNVTVSLQSIDFLAIGQPYPKPGQGIFTGLYLIADEYILNVSSGML